MNVWVKIILVVAILFGLASSVAVLEKIFGSSY